jgi:HAD superfamily hydrolase (TIGR01509 family)
MAHMSPLGRSHGLIDTLTPRPRGVIFDYGNTLIPFGQKEMDAIGGALIRFFLAEIEGADPDRVRECLAETMTRLHRYRSETDRESDPRDVVRLTFRALGAEADEERHVAKGVEVILSAFVAAVRKAAGAERVLGELRERGYKLGLLSNYSLSAAITESLDRLGLTEYFDAVVISADLGLVKPHPELFLEAARRLGVPTTAVLFVGDNPRADIAGAAAVGMRTAHITEHLGGAYFFEDPDENEAEIRPDLVLDRLTSLTEGNDHG